MKQFDHSQWEKIESIVDEALRIKDHQKQAAFIKKACKEKVLYDQVTSFMNSIRKAQELNYME